MEELIDTLNRVLTDVAPRQSQSRTRAAAEEHTLIPRYIVDSLEIWDPSKVGGQTIGGYFDVFDALTTDLTEGQRLTLLRMKMRGGAQTFMVNNPIVRDDPTPYSTMKAALVRWFDREDLDAVLRKLVTAKLGETETLREYAERVGRLARSSVKKEFGGIPVNQMEVVAANRAKTAFIKGLPGELSRPLIANAPSTLEDALEKAESMRAVQEVDSPEDEEWRVSATRATETRRCFKCNETGHLAARCTRSASGERWREEVPTAYRQRNIRRPPQPGSACIFCHRSDHFAVDCPQAHLCELCGRIGHDQVECDLVRP